MHDYTWKIANFEVFNKLKWECFFYNIYQQCEYWVANKKKLNKTIAMLLQVKLQSTYSMHADMMSLICMH